MVLFDCESHEGGREGITQSQAALAMNGFNRDIGKTMAGGCTALGQSNGRDAGSFFPSLGDRFSNSFDFIWVIVLKLPF